MSNYVVGSLWRHVLDKKALVRIAKPQSFTGLPMTGYVSYRLPGMDTGIYYLASEEFWKDNYVQVDEINDGE